MHELYSFILFKLIKKYLRGQTQWKAEHESKNTRKAKIDQLEKNGVTPSVGVHSFPLFSDAARPTGSTHLPNCTPLAPPIPSTCTESHTRKYGPPTSIVVVRRDVTLQFFSGSTGWQWQVAAYTWWTVILNGDRSECECICICVCACVHVCLGGVCTGWVVMGYWGGWEGLPEGVGVLTEVYDAGEGSKKMANERKLFWVTADLVEWDKGWWRWLWCDGD